MNIEFTAEMLGELRKIYDAAIKEGTLIDPGTATGEETENEMSFEEFVLEVQCVAHLTSWEQKHN